MKGDVWYRGLVEEVGTVNNLEAGLEGSEVYKLVIEAEQILEGLKIGDQILVNGVCLTVVELIDRLIVMRIWSRTQAKTNLTYLQPNDKVNLERNRCGLSLPSNDCSNG